MARGNGIILSAPESPRGVMAEGYIATGETPKPGTVMQVDPTVALRGGRFTYKIYARDADGNRPAGPLYVLLEDRFRGDRLETTAYAAGDRCFLYTPIAGEELNMILMDVVGTANITAGLILSIDSGTGKLLASTGEAEPFLLLETVVAPAADQLVWVLYSGY